MVIVINYFSLPLISTDRSLILGIWIFANNTTYWHKVGDARANNVSFLAKGQMIILRFKGGFKRVTHSRFGYLLEGQVQYPGQYCFPVVQFLTVTVDILNIQARLLRVPRSRNRIWVTLLHRGKNRGFILHREMRRFVCSKIHLEKYIYVLFI